MDSNYKTLPAPATITQQIANLCHCPQNVRKTWAVEKNVGRMQKWQTYVVCRPA